MLQKIGAACLLVAACFLFAYSPRTAIAAAETETRERVTEGARSGGEDSSWSFLIVKEEYEDPVERCKRKCEAAWEKENERCRKLRTRKQREKCWRENNAKLAKCTRDCED